MKRDIKHSKKRIDLEEIINPLNGKPYSENYFKLQEKINALPVKQYEKEVINELKKNRVLILEGATGSGKTTQIPKFCLNPEICGGKGVCCTQPRRVAAISVAQRVAEEMDVQLGEEVGYCVRFDDCRSDKTKLTYMTDGMLLRELMGDPKIQKYGVILLDEAHERTVSTDILFGVLKSLLEEREDLKIVVMSATLEATKFKEYFDNAPNMSVEGRTYPVTINYSRYPENDYFEAAVKVVSKIDNEPEGDVLIFMTGEEEIEEMVARINSMKTKSHMIALPLYSALPQQEQQRVFEKVNGRKVIVSTNIAETSVTIDGIVYVIDTGYVKQKVYLPSTRVETLQVTAISQAAAQQRAGRAGRTRPGQCYRLYTEKGFNESLPKQTVPEMLRTSLASVILHMKKIGIKDILHFDYLDAPSPQVMVRALEQLYYLNALDDKTNLTEIGSKISEIPVDPQLAVTLIASIDYNVVDEISTIVSLLNVPSIFYRPKEQEEKSKADAAKAYFNDHESDHITLLNTYNAWIENGKDSKWAWNNYVNQRALKQAESIKNQLLGILYRMGVKQQQKPIEDVRKRKELIRKALCKGFFMQSAHQVKGGYQIVCDNRIVLLHPSSCIGKREWILYNEYVMTKREYVRTASSIQPEWLFEASPKYFAQLDKFKESETTRALKRVKRAMN
ncbi:pre-mRNA-splicing factor ATP-dependent RNA helicase PRP43, putative [Entamoeba histolytica HM-3:IMSS]|uniref:RNA helicase n=6 Tax=Entamoeba histolytica TaxID=5759 RepID=C4LWD6_ENTH1|nr:helicase, putative [Entamoeba histolytica HM-1:IMSS]EMD44587.1 pre-mRNA-splicing factor ATP--dependent RNA helicase PRP43, putative [Entamoeba histolytica KU27]EMS12660.1 pre-mRNA-splicing factor ATP-dependent RNA helicase PRP43, putative [Entamoeba histolytica HM-3:IMSS]ENY64373.1 pre-mRNA-splicing factor ATP-dependent RNA helicase PRP43, putative [Entamoeba histolytica HM-1:IMSS-A]GAT93020.1 helicase putative [Entamoeba histolytica]EAL51520.1 helicase, putative [Entamoeba histolytica HM-1|eukprot:XP_656898.1 helicase, putative [Entamoeba histolytica HM-1:IMSS]